MGEPRSQRRRPRDERPGGGGRARRAANPAAARRATESSPLSDRETEIIRGLAEGKVYKAIASDLGLSTSTVRTHLHNTYGSSARWTGRRRF